LAATVALATGRICGKLFGLLYPDECRICNRPLQTISRIPVCPECLTSPGPLEAEYFCVSCRAPFANEYPLDENGRCALCRLGLNGFDAAWAYGAYEGRLRELIHLFKYSGIAPLAGPLGAFLAQALPLDQRFDMIVPMPLHWLKRWRRGFNQAELLARLVARRSGAPVVSAVRRRRFTPPQASLSHARRRENVQGAFVVKRSCDVKERRVLLIDDVFTTGSTASVCAAALKKAGARFVGVLTLARADRRLLPLSTLPARSSTASEVF
jgi:ComF family protein